MHHVTDQLLRKFPSLFVLISPLSPHAPCMWPFPQPHPKPRTFSLGTKACPRIPLTPWQWSGPRAAPHWAPSEAHVLKATASKGSRVRGPSRTWFNPPVPFASQCPLTFPLFNPHFPRDMRISMMPPPLPNNLMCPSHCCLTYRSHSELPDLRYRVHFLKEYTFALITEIQEGKYVIDCVSLV